MFVRGGVKTSPIFFTYGAANRRAAEESLLF
nr:MAG TPA: hypothetical protein [Caudoviricetes sp.]